MSKNKTPGYYSIIPAVVRYDNSLCANAKLMYGEITALSNSKGYAFATNKYFADLYQVDTRTIRRWIKQLKEYKYILVDFIQKPDGTERRIHLNNLSGEDINVPGGRQNYPPPQDKNVQRGEDNNVCNNSNSSVNNTSTTTNEPQITSSMEKVIEYWNKTFGLVVDESDQKLLKAIAEATQSFEVTELKQAIEYRSYAKYYKDVKPDLRDDPRCFFPYQDTIEKDMKRYPFKLITFEQKRDLEDKHFTHGGNNKDLPIEKDPDKKDDQGRPMYRYYK